MRFIRYIVLAALAIVLISVALANRAPVTLRLLPEELGALIGLQYEIALPLFVVILGGVLAGLLIGFVWEWLREHRHRSEVARQQAEIQRLQRDLRRTRAQRDKDKDEVLTILDQAS